MRYDDLQDVFIKLTFLLRGYDYNDLESPGQELIRLAYQPNSQPFQGFAENVSYLWINYADASTNNQITERQEFDSIESKIISKKYQLRNLDAHWTFYGAQAQDLAYDFRQKLFLNKAKEFMDNYNVKLIPIVPEVVLIYEEINHVWWPRIDIVVRYYVETEMVEDLGHIEVVNIDLNLRTEEKEIVISNQ